MRWEVIFLEVDRERSGGGFSGALGEFLAVRLWICMVGLVVPLYAKPVSFFLNLPRASSKFSKSAK